MKGFVSEPTIEEQDHVNQASKLNNFYNPLENFEPKIDDLSLADSFLDFDALKEFFADIPQNFVMNSLEKIDEFGDVDKSVKMGEEEKTDLGVPVSHGLEKEKNLNCQIEEEMEKVSLVGVKRGMASDEDKSGKVGVVCGSGSVLADAIKKEAQSDSESENESSTSSSSSSGSSSSESDKNDEDEDEKEREEKKKEKEVAKDVKRELDVSSELEEGEIEGVDGEVMVGQTDDGDDEEDDEEEMAGGIDVEFDDILDEDEIGGVPGPIMSKNELQVLPPVPKVDVTLEPHHQMLPVGAVLSVLGVQVIVEGVEKHNPLNEGSILWITESRTPLGIVDELFGPVKNPYYMVRYNSESEVPAGIHVGTLISFVQEFANHVLNDKGLYKKGYDASGENDEEISEAEFSDDEKEAEYRRNLKVEKRGMDDQKPGNGKNNRKKKVKNKGGAWNNGRHSVQRMDGVGQPSPNQNQHHVSPVPASRDHGNCSSSAVGQGFVGGTGMVPQFPPFAQTAGFTNPSGGVWTNMPSQQPQGAMFPNSFPTNGMQWPSQNFQPQPYQMPMMNNMMYLQQFLPNQMSGPNAVLPGGQSNFFAGPTFAPWQGLVGQSGLNQTIGMGIPSQPAHPSMNAGEQGQSGFNQMVGMGLPGQPTHPSANAGEQGNQNFNFQSPAAFPGSNEPPQQFNTGASSGRGRTPYHRRGGRHFGGGRGRGR